MENGRKSIVPLAARRQAYELFAQHTAEAVNKLLEILRNPESSEPARLKAIDMILDRGLGKPLQYHELAGLDGGPVNVQFDLSAVASALANVSTDDLKSFNAVLQKVGQTQAPMLTERDE